MSTPLEDMLAERIRRDGPMPFAAYMQSALYHPTLGYYSSPRPRTGFAGHYVTAPEIAPAYGALWARGLAALWDACDRPDRFDIVEIGPGEGGAARSILGAAQGAFAKALRYHLVERNRTAEKRQREVLGEGPAVQWHPTLEDVPRFANGCVLANEVLDNLPVHLVERRDGNLMEVCVETEGGRLVERLRPPSSEHLERYLERVDVALEEGHRFEVGLAAISVVTRAASLFERGALLLIDYGITAAEASSRPTGTIVCYSQSGADAEPLDRPGDKDITSHANWTAVVDALRAAELDTYGPLPQAAVLRSLGIGEYDDALRIAQERASDRGQGSTALRAISRRQGLRVLTDPGGLGGQQVVAGLRGVRPPSFLVADQVDGPPTG